jgi:hypothetical protein
MTASPAACYVARELPLAARPPGRRGKRDAA